MATTTWKVTSGNWSIASSWNGGVPGTADTALINDATVLLITGTVQAALLDLNPATALTFNLTNVLFNPATTDMTGPVTLNANGSLKVTGSTDVGNGGTAAALVVNIKTSNANFSPSFTNAGVMLLTGGSGSSLAINPASNANSTFGNAGLLTVGSGGALNDDENNINPVNGVFLNAGTLSFVGNGATVNTQGNFVDGVQNPGTIVVNGGGSLNPRFTFVDFLGTLSGNGSVQLRDGTMFEQHGDAGGTVQFASDSGVIEVDEATPGAVFGATPDGFGFTDVVRYTQPIASVRYSGSTSSGQLTVSFTGGGSQQLSFANIPSTDFTHNAISVSDDEVIIACFAVGTRVLTDAGERAVERLRVGDRVATVLGGKLARVRWIGRRRMRAPGAASPLRVAAHAFGENQPRRDVLLSPDHAVSVDGLLVSVRHLANGMTVRREEVAEVTYFHVELDRHEVVVAEGLACESYLDTGNRGAFDAGAAQWIPAGLGVAKSADVHR
jgi:hypothetical protein